MSAVTRYEDAPTTTALVRPIVTAAALIEAHKEVTELVTQALQAGIDYGKVPGTDRPTLLKPGAERLCKAFGCAARFTIVASEADHDRPVSWTKRKKVWRNERPGDKRFDWKEESGASVGLYRHLVRCEVVQRGTDEVIGSGVGSCCTLEAKYCDRPREVEHTILAIAVKRALVAATLNAFALSGRFTQDLEDAPRPVRRPANVDGDGVVRESVDAAPAAPAYGVVRIPGTPGQWAGHAGKAVADPSIPAGDLAEIRRGLFKRNAKRFAELIQAIDAELARRAQLGPAPVAAPAQDQDAAPAAAPAVDDLADALDDDDDDLPF